MIAAPDSRRPPRASSAAPIPPAAPAPGSALTGRPAARVEFGGPRGQTILERGTVAGSAPFCGPNTRAAPHGRAAGIRRRWRRSARRRPAGRARSSSPPSSSTSPRPPSVHGAAAQPDHDPARTRAQRRGDELADSPAVRGQRGLRRRRAAEQGQPAGLRAFQVRGRRAASNTHSACTSWRPAGRDTAQCRRSPSRLASTSTKPGPPSDCGATMNVIAAGAPASSPSRWRRRPAPRSGCRRNSRGRSAPASRRTVAPACRRHVIRRNRSCSCVGVRARLHPRSRSPDLRREVTWRT